MDGERVISFSVEGIMDTSLVTDSEYKEYVFRTLMLSLHCHLNEMYVYYNIINARLRYRNFRDGESTTSCTLISDVLVGISREEHRARILAMCENYKKQKR